MDLIPGDVFISPHSEDDGVLRHHWVVISDPSEDPEKVLIVNWSSWKDGSPNNDDSCILGPRDHRSISVKSFIYYERAQEISLEALNSVLSKWGWPMGEQVSDEVLKRIWKGAIASPKMTNGRKRLLRRQGLV